MCEKFSDKYLAKELKPMKIQALVLIMVFSMAMLCSAGCSKPPAGGTESDVAGNSVQEPNATAPGNPDTPVSSQGGSSGAGGNIAPMAGMGAGGLTPVQGSESIQGGGSGVGQVMKEKAKDIAAKGGGSVGNVGEDGQ